MPSTACASAPTGSLRAAASSSQLANGTSGERSTLRRIEAGDEALEPGPPLDEGKRAQVLLAVDQQIVCAQMGRKLRQQPGVDGLAVEPLLQHVEALHPASRTISSSPSMAPGMRSASIRSGKLAEMSSPVRE